jgi:poly(hydroxyalkanoate) depolymerase family esterase
VTRAFGLSVLLVGVSCGVGQTIDVPEPQSQVQSALELTNFGSNPGGLRMFVTVPTTPRPQPALVVAMHGCSQSAAEYQKAGWDTFANRYGFYVLYPQIGGTACFGWFDSAQTTRGQGQALSIAQAVAAMKTTYGIDATKVFVTGLSAGGGMTAAMLGSYPDVFAAGAVMAGLPYECATSITGASACQQGLDKTPAQWAALVTQANPSFHGPWPRVSIWNGSSDTTVAPKNLNELMEQWTQVAGVDQVADVTSTVGPATRKEYRDSSGVTQVETWLISGMGHGTPVDPTNGCGTAGAFILDVKLCSTEWATRFFKLDQVATDGGVADAGPVDSGVPDAGPVDSGVPDAGPRDAGVDAGVPDAGICSSVNDSNYNHVTAGRAVRCGSFNSYACANGSGENLGLWNTFVTSWVKSTDGHFWSAGRCP